MYRNRKQTLRARLVPKIIIPPRVTVTIFQSNSLAALKIIFLTAVL